MGFVGELGAEPAMQLAARKRLPRCPELLLGLSARCCSSACSRPKEKPFSPSMYALTPYSRSRWRATTESWCWPSACCTFLAAPPASWLAFRVRDERTRPRTGGASPSCGLRAEPRHARPSSSERPMSLTARRRRLPSRCQQPGKHLPGRSIGFGHQRRGRHELVQGVQEPVVPLAVQRAQRRPGRLGSPASARRRSGS